MASRDFDDLMAEAAAYRPEGWDFSFLGARATMERPPWDYAGRIRDLLPAAGRFLDLGTGGAEFLSSLAPFPAFCAATESYRPNVGVAARRLRPLGGVVVESEGAPDNAAQRFTQDEPGTLPFRSGVFGLVIDRHEAFSAGEVARVLRPGGTFLTQQVGPRDEQDLHDLLDAPPPTAAPTVEAYADQLERAGLRVVEAREAFPAKRYADVGAIAIFFLSAPWLIEGFSLDAYRDRLRRLHERIASEGPLRTTAHRYLFEATRG